ncbi:hypothetical protein PR202_gb07132 [Eleusine coracana subsp. coracana]|uniref:Bifunctional inhibitor/plant lipid transfer protein/seed storage helical domain-containing protein n=1 Tax=Eleusine coracana subsp. coracana TaxID=191504 RepID=A0AAV5EBA8_ELECO|nr:hypothetical protein PR202_gb07132 [Eleusine coracana subsp. coracana]
MLLCHPTRILCFLLSELLLSGFSLSHSFLPTFIDLIRCLFDKTLDLFPKRACPSRRRRFWTSDFHCRPASVMAKVVAMLVAVALVAAAIRAFADNYKPKELTECLPPIVSGSVPTATCCTNLRMQQGCFYKYARSRDPNYNKYINSPNTNRVFKTCGIAIPECQWRS